MPLVRICISFTASRSLSSIALSKLVLPCVAPARGRAPSVGVHSPELADSVGLILSRGLLDPRQCLLVVHVHTLALAVHGADLPLARNFTPLTDLVRRHRPRVVDRHALAPEVGGADTQSRFDVALPGCVLRWKGLSAEFTSPDLAHIAPPDHPRARSPSGSIASCSITIAPSISPCSEADSGRQDFSGLLGAKARAMVVGCQMMFMHELGECAPENAPAGISERGERRKRGEVSGGVARVRRLCHRGTVRPGRRRQPPPSLPLPTARVKTRVKAETKRNGRSSTRKERARGKKGGEGGAGRSGDGGA